MQDERRERALRIIKGLLEKRIERGATLAEEAAAVAKVEELLHRYQLTMLDVEKKELKDTLDRFDYSTNKKNTNPGETSIASAVAAGYDCKLVIDKCADNTKFVFLGYKTDVEIAQYVFTYLLRRLTEMANHSGTINGATKQKLVRYRNNFLMGAAGIIRNRLISEKNKETPIEQKENNVITTTSLCLIKKPKVEEYVNSQYKNLYFRPAPKVKYNVNALEEGRKAGQNIPLRKGVDCEQNQKINGY